MLQSQKKQAPRRNSGKKPGKLVLSTKVTPQSYEFYQQTFRDHAHAGGSYVLDAFPDIYRWSIHEFQGIFPEAQRALIVRAFKGFCINPASAGAMLPARCRIVMESDEKASRGIDRDAFFAKMDALPKCLVMIIEIWASCEAGKR
jgi:hypothetical protein